MDFAPTADQQLLTDTARRLLDKECPPALVRAHIDDPGAYLPLWQHLREYTALGSGPATDCCLFLEATGYAAAPGPFLASAGLFTPLVGDDSVTGTVALLGDPTQPFVLEADRVERLAIVGPGPTLGVIDRPDPSRLRLVPTVDFSRRLFAVDLAGCAIDFRPLAPDALCAWRDRAHVSLAAETVGTARRIFTMTLQYAKERHQFGVPIGSFQAIQHKLAEMSLALERATAAVHYGAMTVDMTVDMTVEATAGGAERTRAGHVAQAAAGAAARRILTDGIQIHGGIGYTWEHDLHLFLRRATADEYLLGTTGWHHDRLADLLFA